MRKHTGSLRKVLTVYILLILVVMAVLLLSGTVWTVNNVRKEAVQSNSRTLDTYEHNILEKLTVIDEFLLNTAGNDPLFLSLQRELQELTVYETGYDLVKKFENSMYNDYLDYGYCVISRKNNLYRSLFTGNIPYEQQEQIEAFVREYAKRDGTKQEKDWKHESIGEIPYIMKAYGAGGNYVLAFVDLTSFDDAFFGISESDLFGTALFDREGAAIAGAAGRGLRIQPLKNGETNAEVIGEMLVLGKQVKGTDVWLSVVQENNLLLGNNIFLYYIVTVTAFCLLLIPVSYRLLKRWIVEPVDSVLGTLRIVAGGNLSQRMATDYEFSEFRTIADTFNRMMEEIKDLKIKSMQLEIDKQQAQLQYLQVQLKPHFFLNCLKNVYALAENKKYEMIQDMVTAISYHFRFIMEDSQKLVPIAGELRHIENYVRLQNLLQKDSVELKISMDTRTMEFVVLPMCMQAFVENSIKYGRVKGRKLIVFMKISVLTMEGETYTDILIEDNGPGFSEEVLARINEPDVALYTGKHVGIVNLKNRLRLMYGDKAQLYFYNGEEGAVSELILPSMECEKKLEGGQDSGGQDERTDNR